MKTNTLVLLGSLIFAPQRRPPNRSTTRRSRPYEVAYHDQVIAAIDKTLIPGAKNEELKALLVKVRPAFVAHRDHAKQLQASMASTQ